MAGTARASGGVNPKAQTQKRSRRPRSRVQRPADAAADTLAARVAGVADVVEAAAVPQQPASPPMPGPAPLDEESKQEPQRAAKGPNINTNGHMWGNLWVRLKSCPP